MAETTIDAPKIEGEPLAAEIGVDDARELLFRLGKGTQVKQPDGTYKLQPYSRATMRAKALAGEIVGRKLSKAQTSAWLYDREDLHRFAKEPSNPVGNPQWIAAARNREGEPTSE